MITDMATESALFEGGLCRVAVLFKTDKGLVKSSFILELRRHPELDALVEKIDAAVQKALLDQLSIEVPKPINLDGESPKAN